MPGNNTRINLVMSKDVSTTKYIINENFNSYEPGKFTGGDIWNVMNNDTQGQNTITIEVDPDNTHNKVLRMYKSRRGDTVFITTLMLMPKVLLQLKHV